MSIHANNRPRKTRVNPVIALLIAILLAGLGFGIWRTVEKVSEQTSVEIVPGEFPKKVTEIAKEKIENKPINEVQKTASVASIYPITLSASEANSTTVVVNKKHRLSSDYAPNLVNVRGANMRPEAATALESLLSDVEGTGIATKIISSYRSYTTQESVYSGYVNQYGRAEADTFSARPGHSEHQTGLAVDVGGGGCDLEICFSSTPFGEWIKSNAHLYGYIVRYPEGKESLTGYQYEPWHLRYVGVDVADGIIRTKQTLDQYFNKPAGGY